MDDSDLLDEIFEDVCNLFNLQDELIEKGLPTIESKEDDRAVLKDCIVILKKLLVNYAIKKNEGK